MTMDPGRARALVREHLGDVLPDYLAAMLTGSVARRSATTTSDLDVLVLLRDGAGCRRMTVGWEGTTVDLFAYDRDGLNRWLEKDRLQRRPSLCSIVLDGIVVSGCPEAATQAKSLARAALAAGPRPLADGELNRMRYDLTDVLLDLRSSGDRGEILLLGADAVRMAADLGLAIAGAWSGRGRWLLRALEDHDPALRRELVAGLDALAGDGDVTSLVTALDTVLDRVGGRYLIGRCERG